MKKEDFLRAVEIVEKMDDLDRRQKGFQKVIIGIPKESDVVQVNVRGDCISVNKEALVSFLDSQADQTHADICRLKRELEQL